MRLGGPIVADSSDPGAWAGAVLDAGYRAAYCPVGEDADPKTIDAYAGRAEEEGIVIAEVGAWSNPLSSDCGEREQALEKNRRALALADAIGARCCVNIAGSRGTTWDGPDPANLTRETFDRVVETVREIIDAVRPGRTFYTLETMPWIVPDSAEAYLELIAAVDRERFAVHFDPVNLINSPRRYFGNDELIRDFVRRLGPRIKSCHLKDVRLSGDLTVHIDEVRPGTGGLCCGTLLRELDRLDADLPVMLEHLPNEGEYRRAASHVRRIAGEEGIEL